MRKEEISQRTGVSTFIRYYIVFLNGAHDFQLQATQAQAQTIPIAIGMQKSFHLSHAGQNFKIYSPQYEKLKHPIHSPTMVANSTKTMIYRHGGQERRHKIGSYQQWLAPL